MIASIKIRENQNPLLKSKVPLKIFGFPFRFSVEASSDSKELCLSFSTLFESSPLFKFNYRPNDPCSPFGVVLETGVRPFGSPIGAPISVSAEFNFHGNGNQSPCFVLCFKHQIGDFGSKKRVISNIRFPSQISPPLIHDSNGKNVIVLENPDNEVVQEKMNWTRILSNGFAAAERLAGGGEICARTVAPVSDLAVVNLRWVLKFPGTEEHDRTAGKLPYLVLNKIGIERVHRRRVERGKAGKERDSREGHGSDGGFGDVAKACLGVRREQDYTRSENELLQKEFEKFKEIGDWRLGNTGVKKQTGLDSLD